MPTILLKRDRRVPSETTRVRRVANARSLASQRGRRHHVDVKASSVLITGTTSGVGRALLDYYANRATKVISVNRRRVVELESRYPSVRFECVDVRSSDGVAELVRALAASGDLPEVLILNAGINRVDNDESFQLGTFREVMDTNLDGVLSFVAPLTELPPGPSPRHIVAISSMVNYAGSPYGLGYLSSKKALTTCFEVWSRMYATTDLVFQQVMLGPVPTAIHTLAEHLPAWMRFIKDVFSVFPDRAARAIATFARTRRRKLFLPRRARPLFMAIALGQRLVPGFFQGRKTLAGKRRR
jgi:NAD(P)-dependent dehydrogenase (short-subunit alcohol dehydrogenase family)